MAENAPLKRSSLLSGSDLSHELHKGESAAQHYVSVVLQSAAFERIMAAIIVANFGAVIIETDHNASDETMPGWVGVASWILLVVFVGELAMKLFAQRCRFWFDAFNVFDFFVIGVDFCMSALSAFIDGGISVSALRIVRLARLARATKLARAFPELRLMLAGLIGALHAIFWGTLLLFTVLLTWSVVAVQFIHPLNQEVTKRDAYSGCTRCPHAYASTFEALLTFCTAIVAGDSWGRETVPIIEHFPSSSLFFAGVYLSVGMAILNLILGVIVNVATSEREKMVAEIQYERNAKRMNSQNALLQMCYEMDEDGNGELTNDEIKHGFDHNSAFRETLEGMDIGREDLDIVWTILDNDKSGAITSREFCSQVYKMKSSDTQFMLAYIKFYVTEIKNKLRDDLELLQQKIDNDMQIIESDMTKIDQDVKKVDVEVNDIDQKFSSDAIEKIDHVINGELSKVEKSRQKIADIDGYIEEECSVDAGCEVPLEVGSLDVLVGSDTDLAASSRSLQEHAETLAQLQGIWSQFRASFDATQTRHTDLSKALASQVQHFETVIGRVSDSISHSVAASLRLSASSEVHRKELCTRSCLKVTAKPEGCFKVTDKVRQREISDI